MFPWSREFVLDAGHVAFFGAFYGVVLAIVVTLVLAARRAVRDRRRVEEIAWRAEFEELPPAARACRHQLTGEAPGRECDNAFDCRSCATHPAFVARRAAAAGTRETPGAPADIFGLHMPPDRLYHRGHTFVQPEPDGTVTVGLDDFGRRVVGAAERVSLPAIGSRVTVNGTACRLETRGREVRVLSPVEGEVVEANGEGARWTLRIRPAGALGRHLLYGAEVRAWTLRELERLERALGPQETGLALADGGELVADVSRVLSPAQLDAVLGEMFLEG
jgi:hypothetical protein